MNQSLKEALTICDEIEELLANAMPAPDTQKLDRIRFLAGQLGGHDSYITDQANKLRSRAAIYFSARRHQSQQGGADGLMREMRYSLLNAIRNQVSALQAGMD
ncbi:hypothetical protein [Comamonas terrae]|uniref:Uncharacterized protein n=1 Tax=Comamonas terrae TaxID=673548 RepID=A0ABW5USI5_9BURK|nr:hypothetical protein [Comamonas terrae]